MESVRDTVSEHRVDLSIQVVGLVAAVSGTLLLIRLAGNRGEPDAVRACAVYGAALIAMFTCSLFNASAPARYKGLARLLDHCVIYLLIAGTYTPFSLMIGGAEGAALLGLVWGCHLQSERQKRSKASLPSPAHHVGNRDEWDRSRQGAAGMNSALANGRSKIIDPPSCARLV